MQISKKKFVLVLVMSSLMPVGFLGVAVGYGMAKGGFSFERALLNTFSVVGFWSARTRLKGFCRARGEKCEDCTKQYDLFVSGVLSNEYPELKATGRYSSIRSYAASYLNGDAALCAVSPDYKTNK